MSAQQITAIVTTILLALAASAAPARAQGTYVSASLVGDITRVAHSDGFFDESAGGEAIGFALRVGTPVGANWGVEAEFARSGTIANSLNPRALPAVTDPFSTVTGAASGGGYFPSLPGSNSLSLIFPTPFGYDVRTTVQHTTLATTAVVTWPVDVWFGGSRTFEAMVDLGAPITAVTLDPQAMTEAGVSVQQIQGVLQANNLTLPSGQLTDGGEKIPVSTTASIATVEALEELVVGVQMVAPPAQPGASAEPGASAAPGASPAAAPTPRRTPGWPDRRGRRTGTWESHCPQRTNESPRNTRSSPR